MLGLHWSVAVGGRARVGPTGERRVRRWESGNDVPTGFALAALRYLRAIDRALDHFDAADYEHGLNAPRDAPPEREGATGAVPLSRL